jgi:hypothetical protein
MRMSANPCQACEQTHTGEIRALAPLVQRQYARPDWGLIVFPINPPVFLGS